MPIVYFEEDLGLEAYRKWSLSCQVQNTEILDPAKKDKRQRRVVKKALKRIKKEVEKRNE